MVRHEELRAKKRGRGGVKINAKLKDKTATAGLDTLECKIDYMRLCALSPAAREGARRRDSRNLMAQLRNILGMYEYCVSHCLTWKSPNLRERGEHFLH